MNLMFSANNMSWKILTGIHCEFCRKRAPAPLLIFRLVSMQLDTSTFSPHIGYTRLNLARLTTDTNERKEGTSALVPTPEARKNYGGTLNEGKPTNHPRPLQGITGLRAALKRNATLAEKQLADQLQIVDGDGPTEEYLR